MERRGRRHGRPRALVGRLCLSEIVRRASGLVRDGQRRAAPRRRLDLHLEHGSAETFRRWRHRIDRRRQPPSLHLTDGTLPFFKFTACKKEFPYLASKGLSYMTIEILSNWQSYGPQIYLSLRLAYDPKADADAIMEDYWEKFYGPKAGPHMKAYWMGIDTAQGKLQSHAGCFFGLGQMYTPEFLRQCEERLTKAA